MESTNMKARVLEAGAESILSALRVARDATERGMERDAYAKNVAADSLSSSKIKPVHQLLAMVQDFIDRGAPEADVLGIPQALTDYISAQYRAREAAIAFDDAHVKEERAEGKADVAEAEFRLNPSPFSFQKLRRATMQHIVTADLQLRAAARHAGVAL